MKYRTIVADPPWPYPEGFALGPGHGNGLENRPLPYDCMTITQIMALPVPDLADRNARLFLWGTNRYLREAFEVMAEWRFLYRQTLVWHKAGVNLPAHIAPNSAEFLLVGIKGSPDRLGTLTDAVYKIARRGTHSQKPDAFLDLVEQVSPGPYLEMFARRVRLGWDGWGNEWYENASVTL